MATRLIGTDSTDPWLPAVVKAHAVQAKIDDVAGLYAAGDVEGALAELGQEVADLLITHTGPPGPPGAAGLMAAASNAETNAGVLVDKAVTPASFVNGLAAVDLRRFGDVALDATVDATAVVNAALAWLYANGGGTLMFPEGRILIAGQVVIPNTPHVGVGSEAPTQPAMVWRGAGAFASGQTTTGEVGGTVLVCTYVGGSYNAAKFVTYGLGQWAIEDITFRDTTANATTPFLYTTNTTLKVMRCAFLGATQGTACAQDGIVLGGTLKPISTGYQATDSAFQGYGTVISSSYFDRVRRCVYGRSYCNQVQVVFNMMDKGCGTNLAAGACVEFDGSLDNFAGTNKGDYCTNNVVMGNYMHFVGGYTYQVRLKKATRCVVAYNGFIDPGPNALAGVRCEGVTDPAGPTNYRTIDNLIIGNAVSMAGVEHLEEDALSAGRNMQLGGGVGEASNVGQNLRMPFTARILIDPPSASANWAVWDGTTTYLQVTGDTPKTIGVGGPMTIVGNPTVAGTTKLTVGNNVLADDATILLRAPTGKSNQIQLQRNGVNSWQIYDANSSQLFFRDNVNGVMTMGFVAGAGTAGRVDFAGGVQIAGKLAHQGTTVGFYNATPVVKAASPGTATGTDAAVINAVVTALRNLGLVT